jgi:hypothetical protein
MNGIIYFGGRKREKKRKEEEARVSFGLGFSSAFLWLLFCFFFIL